jgi:sugar transferase (PEP-CTERM/EpsH1 system associated)
LADVPDLVFLSHRIPYPPDKGEKIRAWHFLRYLAERYRVHAAFFIDDPEDIRCLPKLEQICASVEWRPLRPNYARFRGLAGLVDGAPLTRGYFRDSRLQRAIDRIIRDHRPTHAFVFCSAMAPYVERHRFSRCVIDMADVDSAKWRHYATVTSGLSRVVYSREARTLLALERRVSRFADRVLFVSGAEADLFRRLAPEAASRVGHISNGVDTQHFDPLRHYPNPFDGAPAIVFVGAMDYRPNVDAVEWFAARVMPMLRSAVGPPSFWIVGAHPAAAVRRLAAKDIRVTGRVADVRPYLAHAAAAVAPLRIARGIQNKVLEAMAMAAPVIVTPEAREGLEACRAEVIEASTASQFAEKIRGLLLDGEAARQLGRLARERVRDDFGWQSSFDALDRALEPDLSAVSDPDRDALSRSIRRRFSIAAR